ncbi:MAG TPA: alkaline phosphatase family protein [Steroidobacteraceae bacterium]|nr:alkaline phosphatase family protein [Steroidobacteraceae bacterium]
MSFSAAAQADAPHNLILFVPDGLRSRIVDAAHAPAMATLRAAGVDFRNSHSLFPTFTTANASAFATGHELGDTGDFSNLIYTGVRVLAANGTLSPFLESDPVLKEVNAQFSGNYLDEVSIIAAARAKGYGTALIGKLGPAVIFDLAALTPDPKSTEDGTLVIDDTTGAAGQEVPLSDAWKAAFKEAKIAQVAPSRGDNGNFGDAAHAGTLVPDLAQQQYFLEAALKVALPRFAKSRKPFVMVFWSRDPDGTQHNQGDSFHGVVPGINGPTSFAAIRNADDALDLIEARLKQLKLYDSTNIIVAADHGFSTIRKTGTQSPSAAMAYRDVKAGELPIGFLALDLYADLKGNDKALRLFDPDAAYHDVDWTKGVHPARGNGLIGKDADHPEVVVVANGGSDLIYLPDEPPVWQRSDRPPENPRSKQQRRLDQALARRVVDSLLTHDYVSGIFIDTDRFGSLPGTLSLTDIGLAGAAVTPHPDIVVNFASKVIPGCTLGPDLCAEEVADTVLVEGQGMHGSFSRADTWNFMAAYGPDFKTAFVDDLPASNADIGATMAQLLGLTPPSRGSLKGRVLTEALRGGATPDAAPALSLESRPGLHGLKTVLRIQKVGDETYLDAGGFPGRTVGLGGEPTARN